MQAKCHDGRVESVAVRNHPSFADKLDAALEVPGMGTLTVDTAYGGDSFVIVDAPALGFAVWPDEARDLAETGMKITKAANEQLGFMHPENPDWAHISFCQFAMPVERKDGILRGRNAVAIRPGKIDRSPTGTGCSARMAVLHAKGQMTTSDVFHGISIIDTQFNCTIAEETQIAGRPAIIPTISGRAWLTGQRTEWLDPNDPFPAGYRLSDTWPRLT